MTQAEKDRLREINRQIEILQAEKAALNPYAGLKDMSNKAFGEKWSENWICSKCPNLTKNNGSGHDLRSANGKLWEVKSSRLPALQITFNQCHPYECDYFLFVLYDTVEGEEIIYLVPSEDIKNKFCYSRQHEHSASKEEADCISIGYNKTNKNLLETEYRVLNWEALNSLAQ